MRALARWGITPLLAAPLGAWAFGLGDIELQSALNQPFQAQIALCPRRPRTLPVCASRSPATIPLRATASIVPVTCRPSSSAWLRTARVSP